MSVKLTNHYYDHLGSKIASETFDESSTKISQESFTYDTWGNVLSGNKENASFTGKRMDSTGLYYFNARYYDPKLRQFLTEDSNKSGECWYNYCSNDPINKIDPDGREDLFTMMTNSFSQIDKAEAAYRENQSNYPSLFPDGYSQKALQLLDFLGDNIIPKSYGDIGGPALINLINPSFKLIVKIQSQMIIQKTKTAIREILDPRTKIQLKNVISHSNQFSPGHSLDTIGLTNDYENMTNKQYIKYMSENYDINELRNNPISIPIIKDINGEYTGLTLAGQHRTLATLDRYGVDVKLSELDSNIWSTKFKSRNNKEMEFSLNCLGKLRMGDKGAGHGFISFGELYEQMEKTN